MDYYDLNGVPDTITFDTKLAGQTIELDWGSLDIYRPVVINAPKTQFPLANYDFVTIQWTHWSAARDTGSPDYGTDWSVMQINIAPAQSDLYPNYNKGVSLGGLRITGGRGPLGGGIQANGIFSLQILNSEISGNTLNRFDDDGGTSGGGIFTTGAELAIPRLTYGPRVSIAGSKIHGNATDNNDNHPNPGPDYGGGIYLGFGSSLTVSGTTFSENNADNGGAAIYMEGGAFFEYPNVVDAKPVFVTSLQIHDSDFVENEITSYAASGPGGAIVINDTTAAMIADTSFNFNQAKSHGGAIHITGPGGIGPNNVSPYSQLIGEVNIVGCTFEGNLAAQIGKNSQGDDVIRENGSGGAINSDGIHNRVFLVNSTLGGNSTTIGKGGAVAVLPSNLYYDHIILFEKSFDGRTLSQSIDQGPRLPGPHPGTTLFQIDNTTIAHNSANGQYKLDDQLGKNILHGARGGGIAVIPDENYLLGGVVSITSTIVALNTTAAVGFGPDIWCADDTVSLTNLIGLPGQFNLVGAHGDPTMGGSGQFNLATSVSPGTQSLPLDPLLDPLANYGGSTKTYRLRFEPNA